MMTSTIRFPVVKETAIGAATVQAVEGRELHGALSAGRDFATWIKSRIQQLGLEEGVDYASYEVFPGSGENLRGGRPTKEYALTLHSAKHVAMVEKNETGKRVRNYFIEREREAIEGMRAAVGYQNVTPSSGLTFEQKMALIETAKDLAGKERAAHALFALFPELVPSAAGAHNLVPVEHRLPNVPQTVSPGTRACLRTLLGYEIAGEAIGDLMRRSMADPRAYKKMVNYSIRPYAHHGEPGFIVWTSTRRLRTRVFAGTPWDNDRWISTLLTLPGAAGFDLLAHANSKVATRGQIFLPASLLE